MHDAETPYSLKKEMVIDLFNEIGRQFASRDEIAEIALYGGAALMLAYGFREATHDVDFMPVSDGGVCDHAIGQEDSGRTRLA